jgi:hypothetical protein
MKEKKLTQKSNKRGEPKINVLTYELLASIFSFLMLTLW